MKKGLLIVVSGPSGVGKGTILSSFVDDPEMKIAYSVSMTTRGMREGEVDGVNYFFTTVDQFKDAIKAGKMLEYTVYSGNYYGTPLEYVEKLRSEGKNVLLEIEIDGAKQIRAKCPEVLSIFITPPSFAELAARLKGRGTETDEEIDRRLAIAETELQNAYTYRYVICNDKLETACDIVRHIIEAHMKEE